ncbi:MAG: DNA alkylation repair protein [bacterium]
MSLTKLKQAIAKQGNPKKAKLYARFFKTGKGQYGEGDKFLGLTVPEQRNIAKQYQNLSLADVKKLLASLYHEHRLTGSLILVAKYKSGDDKQKKQFFDFYLKNTHAFNNWDLVDLTSPNIVGDYLLNKDKSILYKLAKSNNLWQRRISIIATFAFINNNQLNDTIKLAKILLNDKHDLIHKAAGWMLREAGKRDIKVLKKFLDQNVKQMPRTMLRYSIEKFPEKERKYYLKKL